MAGVVVAVTVALFLSGRVVTGVIVVVALAVRREDRRYTLAREAPDRMSRSARKLNGVGPQGLGRRVLPGRTRTGALPRTTRLSSAFPEIKARGPAPAGRPPPGTLPMTGGLARRGAGPGRRAG